MMNYNQIQFALDANVLINAYWDYYPIDIFPGFWDFLSHNIAVGQILIIDRVRAEIKSPRQLTQWVELATNGEFVSTASQPVVNKYRQMADWVHGNPQFLPSAGEAFSRGADGWLAAYASVNGFILVTNEVFNPNVKRKVPLPNLCDEFGVTYQNITDMAREFNARFDWSQSQ